MQKIIVTTKRNATNNNKQNQKKKCISERKDLQIYNEELTAQFKSSKLTNQKQCIIKHRFAVSISAKETGNTNSDTAHQMAK